MAVIINGKSYDNISGRSISITNNKVIIDGKNITSDFF